MQIASRHLKHSHGFTYIGLMLIVAIAGIALAGVGIVWKTEMQRENEKELRFAGEQYVAAIASYYECKVCGPQQLPKSLKDLLKDSRSPSVVHHIRKLYRDPMTRSNDWGLIKNGDRIMGVYSKSKLEPLAKPRDLDLLNKKNNTTKLESTVNSTQAGGNNVSKNLADLSVTNLNKLGVNNADALIHPKKPSYQDWQFVYGGASNAQVSADSSNLGNSTAPVSNNLKNNASVQNASQVSTSNEFEVKKREEIKLFCQKEYNSELQNCQQRKVDGDDAAGYELCTGNADKQFEDCNSKI